MGQFRPAPKSQEIPEIRAASAIPELGLVERAGASGGGDDELTQVRPLLDRVGDFAAFLGQAEDQQAVRSLRMAETTGRPLGGTTWIEEMERLSGRSLAPKKRGPKPRER